MEFSDTIKPIYLDPKSYDKQLQGLVVTGWGNYEGYGGSSDTVTEPDTNIFTVIMVHNFIGYILSKLPKNISTYLVSHLVS